VNRRVPEAILWPALFLLAAAVWLMPIAVAPCSFPIWVGGGYTDLLITHWPNAVYLRRALMEWGQVPLWNPLILSGAPFAADPLSGLWYLPNWLAVLLPSPLAFNLMFWVHLAWAGLGGMQLARGHGVGREGAALTGVLVCGAPKLIGHIGLGHLGLVEAVCWTPWVLHCARAAIARLPTDRRGAIRWAALSGALLGVVFLADPRWALPTGFLVAGGMLWSAFQSPPAKLGFWRPAIVAAAFAAATCAALAFPLLEFLPLTTRAGLASSERTVFSLPPPRLLGLWVADLGGWPEWMTYGTLTGLLLALMAVVRRAPGRWFWSAVLLISLAFALGSHIPVYPALAGLPGFSVLRVPARFLFLASLAMAVLAGMGLDSIISGIERRFDRATRLLCVALGGSMLAFGAAGSRLVKDGAEAWWVAAILGPAAAVLGLLTVGRAARRAWLVAGWIALAVVELAWVNWTLLEGRSLQEALLGQDEAASILVLQQAPGERVFSPSYSVPQQTAATLGLELADGINPMQLAGYVRALGEATGFEWSGYGVTVPPFPGGDPSVDWGPQLDAARLGLLSVGTIVSAYPLTGDDIALQAIEQGTYIYRNTEARPRAWVQRAAAADGAGDWQAVGRWSWSPNRIEIQADGPGMLVLSETAYPGWLAEVDGQRAELLTIAGILRGVELPQGRHTIVVFFRPWSVYLGLAVTLLAFTSLWVVWRWK
jgi:hypothetical protein